MPGFLIAYTKENKMAITKPIKNLLGYGINTKPTYVFGKSIGEAQEEWGGTDLARLGSNENAYGPSPKSVEAICQEALEANRYPDPTGLKLKTLLANKHGLTIENFALSNGSADLMAVISRVFVCPGDEVVMAAPTFSEYKTQAVFNQGTAVVINIDEETYELDLDAMFAAVNEKTKMVWICNPNNPTGVAVNGDKLEAFIKKLPEEVVVVLDEAYIEFVDDPSYRSMIHLIQDYNVIILRTFSKFYGLGAMRLGYCVARTEITDCINAHITSFPVSSLSLAAACAAYTDEEYQKKVYEGITRDRKFCREELEKLGWKVYPSQTNFYFVDPHNMTSVELTDKLLTKGIIIRGNFRFPRITVGTREENERLVQACREIAEEMK